MSIAGTIDAPLELFGGLVTDLAAADLPDGVSPDCQDCAFQAGSVKTRPGLVSLFAALAGNPTINYTKTYTQPNLNETLLLLDSTGTLWSEAAAGAPVAINTGAQQSIKPGSYAKSCSLFGREYIALGDGQFGIDIPRQYDGTNFDRVSQEGPGAAPAAVDVLFSLASISRTGGVITGVINAVPSVVNLTVGGMVTIAGVTSDATFNGTFPVLTVSASGGSATQFTAWSAPGNLAINTLTRASNVVTAVLALAPTFTTGATVIVAGASDASYNGSFTVSIISGNTVTWNQTGANSSATGGVIYSESYQASVYSVGPIGYEQPLSGGLPAAVLIGNQITNFPTGNSIVISGNSLSGWNGTFPISTSYPPIYLAPGNAALPASLASIGATIVYFSGTGLPSTIGYGGSASAPQANSSPSVSGVAGPGGNIAAGVHQVTVAFLTRQGYITKPAPPISWTSNGNCIVQFTNIPIGPSNVVARILIMTGAGGDTFFYEPAAMQISDNVTQTLLVNIADSTLLAGSAAASLFNLVELGECSGVIGYADRLFWWGERNKLNNFVNLSFDGGFADWSNNYPLGWTPDPTYFAGGGPDTTGRAVWGGAYMILGNGVAATVGKITQSGAFDYLGVPILQAGVSYSVRVRACNFNGLTQGTLRINLYSATGGILAPGLALAAGSTTTTMQEYTALITPVGGLSSIPGDLSLQVYADGTPTNAYGWVIDCMQVFPTNTPYNNAQLRASYADDPESYDGVTGVLAPDLPGGQSVRSAFVITDRSSLIANDHLHLVTDSCITRTQDPPVSEASSPSGEEPANWDISLVSNTVGTPSINGVGGGEDWVVIAHSTGLYLYYFGVEPTKISQEIQPTWTGAAGASGGAPPSARSINWEAGRALWVQVDLSNKRILIGAPMNASGSGSGGASTVPNKILVLDYRGLISSSEIISTPPVHFSSFNGKMISLGLGRRWCIWNIAANCAWFEPPATPLQVPSAAAGGMFLGNSAGNGKLYYLSDAQFSDDGAAIQSYYTTYFFLTAQLEQQYQMRAHRKLFSYLTLYCEGSGTLNLSAFVDSESFATALPALTLASPGPKDLEMPINLLGERVAFQVGSNAAGNWFRLQKFMPCLLPDPWAPVRGGN